VETLYFDILQFTYHLALAILVGGALVLGAAAAPAIFSAVASRGEAGAIFGAILARDDGLAILSVVLVVVTSVLNRRPGDAPRHPLARPRRALRRDPLLERVGESCGACRPRPDARVGRPA
jgi:hypothetical protein